MANRELDKLTAIRFEQKVIDILEKIGEELDRPVAWLVRRAVDEFIERYKAKK